MRRIIIMVLALLFTINLWFSDPKIVAATQPKMGQAYFIASGNLLLAGNRNGKWLTAQDAAKLLTGKEVLVFYSWDKRLGTGKNAVIKSYADGVALELKRDYSSSISRAKFFRFYLNELGLSGGWPALPRVPRIENSNLKVYRDAVKEILLTQGLSQSRVELQRVFRIDLEGDGVDEVLITATDWDLESRILAPTSGGHRGSYSIIILRKTIQGQVKNILLRAQFTKDKPDNAYIFYTPFMLDLDNDGVMEVVIEGRWAAWSRLEFYTIMQDSVKLIFATSYGA